MAWDCCLISPSSSPLLVGFGLVMDEVPCSPPRWVSTHAIAFHLVTGVVVAVVS